VWYPTLPDVLDVHERIASFNGRDALVRDQTILDRVVLAPQRAEGNERTAEGLFHQVASERLGQDRLAKWIELRLSSRFDRRHSRRILAALNRLATVMEDLEDVPGVHQHGERSDRVGYSLCTEVVSLFGLEKTAKERVRESYQAVNEKWGTVFES
jgi:hypothetical protein